jgi:hypothetical protein
MDPVAYQTSNTTTHIGHLLESSTSNVFNIEYNLI